MKSFWENKNVLVTGVAGFVGSHVGSRLLEEGANVVGLLHDLNVSQGGALLPLIDVIVGDVGDYELVREIVSSREIDVIFHFAAYSIVRIAARDPLTTYRTNVMGTVSLLEAARNVGRCHSIVVASSDKAYGDHEKLPYTENFPLQPKNTYDTSKACMDMISQTFGNNYGLPVIITRSSNIYGPGDFNFSRLIPNTIRRVLSGEPPLLYTDIERMEREFIYIDDVVDAYMMLGQLGKSSVAPGGAFNIGGTGPIKIRRVAEMICDLSGREDLKERIEIIQREAAFYEIEKQCIDSTKLQVATGWKPKTHIVDGISKTIEWMGE